ncbi:hypothetical protein RCL1_006957 [Eukaryota sp. TZLM3-RCL]
MSSVPHPLQFLIQVYGTDVDQRLRLFNVLHSVLFSGENDHIKQARLNIFTNQLDDTPDVIFSNLCTALFNPYLYHTPLDLELFYALLVPLCCDANVTTPSLDVPGDLVPLHISSFSFLSLFSLETNSPTLHLRACLLLWSFLLQSSLVNADHVILSPAEIPTPLTSSVLSLLPESFNYKPISSSLDFSIIFVNSTSTLGISFAQLFANELGYDYIDLSSIVQSNDELFNQIVGSNLIDLKSKQFESTLSDYFSESNQFLSSSFGLVVYNFPFNNINSEIITNIFSKYKTFGITLNYPLDIATIKLKSDFLTADDVALCNYDVMTRVNYLGTSFIDHFIVLGELSDQSKLTMIYDRFPFLFNQKSCTFHPEKQSFSSFSEALVNSKLPNIPLKNFCPSCSTVINQIEGNPEICLIENDCLYFYCSEKCRDESLTRKKFPEINFPEKFHVLVVDYNSQLTILDQESIRKSLGSDFVSFSFGKDINQSIIDFNLSKSNLPESKFFDQSDSNQSKVIAFCSVQEYSELQSIFDCSLEFSLILIFCNSTSDPLLLTTRISASNAEISVRKQVYFENLVENFADNYLSFAVVSGILPWTNQSLAISDPISVSSFLNGYCPYSLLENNQLVKKSQDDCLYYKQKFYSLSSSEILSQVASNIENFDQKFQLINSIPPQIISVLTTPNLSVDRLMVYAQSLGFATISLIDLLDSKMIERLESSRKMAEKVEKEEGSDEEKEVHNDVVASETFEEVVSSIVETINHNLFSSMNRMLSNHQPIVLFISRPFDGLSSHLFSQSNLIGSIDWFEKFPENLVPNLFINIEQNEDKISSEIFASKASHINLIEQDDEEEVSNQYDVVQNFRKSLEDKKSELLLEITEAVKVLIENHKNLVENLSSNFEVVPIICDSSCSSSYLGSKFCKILTKFSSRHPPFVFGNKKKVEPVKTRDRELILTVLPVETSTKLAHSVNGNFITVDRAAEYFKNLPNSSKNFCPIFDLITNSNVIQNLDLIADLLIHYLFEISVKGNFSIIHCENFKILNFVLKNLTRLPINYSVSIISEHNHDELFSVVDSNLKSMIKTSFQFSTNTDIITFSSFLTSQLISPLQSKSQSIHVELTRYVDDHVIPSCCVLFALKDLFYSNQTPCFNVLFNDYNFVQVSLPSFSLFNSIPRAFALFSPPLTIRPVRKFVDKISVYSEPLTINFDCYCPVNLIKEPVLFRKSDQSFLIEVGGQVYAMYDNQTMCKFISQPHYHVYMAQNKYKELKNDSNYDLFFKSQFEIARLPVDQYVSHVFSDPLTQSIKMIAPDDVLIDLIYPGLSIKQTHLLLIALGLRAFNPKSDFPSRNIAMKNLKIALERAQLIPKLVSKDEDNNNDLEEQSIIIDEIEKVKNQDILRLFRDFVV